MYEAEFELEAELEDLMTVLAKSNLVSEAESFAPLDLLREQAIIADLIARGVHNENQIADAVFFNRHPDRNGRRLAPGESALVQEWVQIRDQLVRPMLGNGAVSRPPAPRGSGAHSTAAGNVGDNDVTVALRIANNKPVPNMPGVTIQQLIERYRPQISPEIPLPVLVAFLRYESGGNFEECNPWSLGRTR